jgi:hypothetical protein
VAKSCSVVVRVFDGEAPYLQSFIDHHRSIGIEQFYPVIAPGGAPLCREILSRNKLSFTEVEGQKIGAVRGLIKEDYVAVIDADEYLHPDLLPFIQEERFQSLAMPWRMTATLSDSGFESDFKRFFVFPQIKSVMRTRTLTGLGLHRSGTRGRGRCLGLSEGMPFPVHHYYLRGLDDLMLKEGGVVKRTLAHSTGRKSVALGEGSVAQPLAAFPSRHARVAFLLRVLDQLTDQRDPYVLFTDQSMLDRLREQMSVDLDVVKAELKQSIDNIYGVFRKRSICNQIKDVERILDIDPRKISYQKRVLRQLRSDFKVRQSWPSRLLNSVGIDHHVLSD